MPTCSQIFGMFGLVLVTCCVAGWAASTPTGDAESETPHAHGTVPCVVLLQEDVARLFAALRNISEEIRSCTNISEALQTKAILNENQIREQQEVNAQLEAKHKQMEEKIRLAGTTKQQLQEQLLQLQMEELQQKHEEIQAKTKNLEAKSALQKAEGEEGQLNSETGLLEQEFQLAKERDQHIETLVDILSQNVTQVIGTKNTLIDLKNDYAEQVTSLTQNLNNTVDMINDLSHENKQLREKKDQINTAGQSLQETKQHLEQKRTALTTQRAELSASVDQVTREKEQLLLSIETLNIDMDQIEFNLRKVRQDLATCDRLSDMEWVF
ncbi:fibrinogen- and Ig-binding protein isoform X3 [Penaeus vannamei]|uniref:fibrinogen- and Ig-binding protein isoform X3 n=1 Tax=Penaeus vannamei TaxID=6689 RepID=UPI00387F6E24